eukprot:356116-Chlamydomonas_euryale.AAC.8
MPRGDGRAAARGVWLAGAGVESLLLLCSAQRCRSAAARARARRGGARLSGTSRMDRSTEHGEGSYGRGRMEKPPNPPHPPATRINCCGRCLCTTCTRVEPRVFFTVARWRLRGQFRPASTLRAHNYHDDCAIVQTLLAKHAADSCQPRP